MSARNSKSIVIVFLIVLIFGCISMAFSLAEELKEAPQVLTQPQGYKDKTKIIISTSGPAKFSSFWLDNPPRLVIEFQTRNIISKIDNELEVNQGVIKRITSTYFGEGEIKTLKALTFELTQKVPYQLWQEENSILLDIQIPPEIPLLSNNEKEVFTNGESKEAIHKRLKAMDTALKQSNPSQSSIEVPKLTAGTSKAKRKNMGFVFLLTGLFLTGGLGLLVWWFWYRYLVRKEKAIDSEMTRLKRELQEKDKLIEQKEVIYKAVELASRQREKEFDQLKTESQKEQQLLEQEQKARKTAEKGLSQKEKEVVEVKGSLESLKEVLVEKGIAKKLTTAEKEIELWISGKSAERRELPRLDLSKDYNRTIILRIESADKSKSIKSFANNIGLEGLCFETRHEFDEKEKLSVRLFFFGDKVPMMRMQAKVIWSKIDTPVNRYGISFTSQEEKVKTELDHYIESKILK